MSSTDHLSEIESLRSQVADLTRALAERDQAILGLQRRQPDSVRLESERDLRFTQCVVDRAEDGVLWADDSKRFIYANEAACRLLGYSNDELLTLSISDIAPYHDPTRFQQHLDQIKQGTAANYESIHRRKDGTEFPIEASVTYLEYEGRGYTCGIVRDITERKHIEQERLQALHNLQNIMETVPDIMFTLDTQGNMVNWNRRVGEVTGYSPEELLNKPALAFVPPEQQARTAAAIQRAFTEGYAELDGQLLTKDLRNIPYHWTGALLKDSHGEPIGITGIGRDVSGKKGVEEALRESEQRFALAVEGSNDILWDARRLPGEPWCAPQTPIWWSPRVRELLGLGESDSFETLEQWAARLHPDDKDYVFGQLAAHVEQRVPYDVEYRLCTNQGDYLWVRGRGQAMWDEQGEVRRMSGSCQNITDRKRAEKSLCESEERYRSVVELSPNGVIVYSNGKKVYVNQTACTILRAASSHQLLENPTFHISHPDDYESIHASIAQILATGEPVRRVERKYQRLDGTTIFVEVDAGRIMWNGEPAVQVIFADITNRKLAEAALHESEAFNISVLNSLSAQIAVLNPQGIIIAVNKPWQRFAEENGSPRLAENSVGLNYLDVCAQAPMFGCGEAAGAAQAGILTVLAGKQNEFYLEYPCHSPDQQRWFLMHVTPLLDSQAGVVVAHEDITERKQAEGQLRLSEQRQELALSGANLGLWDWDVFSGKSVFDARWCSIIGYGVDELEPHVSTWRSLLHPEDEPAIQPILESHLKNETPDYEAEFRMRHKAGHWTWILARGRVVDRDQAGAPLRMAGTHMDITDRKRAQEKRYESEAQLLAILDNSPSPIFLKDLEGRYLRVNREFATVFRLTGEEIVGRTDRDIFPPEQAAIFQMNDAKVLQDGMPLLFEEVSFHGDDPHIAIVHKFPLRDEKGTLYAIGGIVTDITGRKCAERALRESEERLRLSLEAANQGIYDLNVQTGETHVSSGYATMLGHDPAAFHETNAAWIERLHPDDRERVADYYRAYVAGKIPEYRVEFRQRTRGGGWRWILSLGRIVERDARGEPLRMLGTHTDITERKQVEEDLRVSEERLQIVACATNDAIWDWDLNTDEVKWNQGFETLFGYKSEDIEPSAESWYSRLHPDDRERVIAEIHAAIDHGEQFWCDEYRFLRADGSYAYIFDRGYILHDSAVKPNRMIGSMQDITVRKQAEEALRASEERFDLAVRGSNTGIWDWDLRTGKTYFSPLWKRMLGYEEHELRGEFFEWEERLHPDDRERSSATVRAYLEGTTPQYELEHRLRHKDGRYRWILARGVSICDTGGKPYRMAGSHIDITEEKQTQEILAQRERQLQTVLDALPVGVWFTDQSGRVLLANPAARQIWSGIRQVGVETTDNAAGWWEATGSSGDLHRWALSQALTKGIPSLYETLDLECLDGAKKTIRNTTVPVRGEAGVVLGAIVLNEDVTVLRKAQEALKLTQFSVDHAVEGFFWIGSDARILSVNDAACRMLEYTRDELTAMSLYDIDPNFPSEAWPAHWEDLKHKGSLSFETKHWSRTGRILDTEVTVNYLQHEGKEYNCAIMRDIGERKRVEAALRASEERYRALYDETPTMYFTLTTGGTVLSVNRFGAEQLGYWVEELIGISVSAVYHEDDKEVFTARLSECLATPEKKSNWEFRKVRKDGSIIWVRETARVAHSVTGETIVLVTCEDVTERKRAEEALRRSEERFRTMFTQAPMGMALIDSLTGQIYEANPKYAQIAGRTVEEIRNLDWMSITHPDDVQADLNNMARLNAGEMAGFQIEKRYVRPDGAVAWINLVVAPVLVEGHSGPRHLAMVNDITERKHLAEREVSRLRQLKKLYEFSMTLSGDPGVVLEHAVRIIGELFEVQVVCLSEIVGQELYFKSVYVNGQTLIDAGHCSIGITPCATVEQTKDLRTFDRVMERFPQASFLRDHQAVSYCGFPALDSEGRVVAVTCLLDNKPHEFTQEEQDLLRIFGQRIATEIERSRHAVQQKQAADKLRQSHVLIRQIIDTDPSFIFAKDREGRFTIVNKAVADAYGSIAEDLVGKTDADLNRKTGESTFFRGIDLDVMDTHEERFVPEEIVTDVHGNRRWVQTVKRPILDETGRAIMVLGAATDITERKRMEEALRQQERDLRAALEERERISQDLHDGILQSLFAVGLGLEATKSTMPPKIRKMSGPPLDKAIGQLNLVMHEIRNFIAGLGSDLLKGKDLSTALQQMLTLLTQSHATRVRLAVEDRAAKALSAEQSLHLFHVIQEAVSNCIRHGRAQEARVSIKLLKQGVRLRIRDNGCGFNQNAVRGSGHGLSNMAARAKKIGGRFAILSKANQGTRVVLDLPKEDTHASR